MALNKVMLIGNVGNDPEIRYLESNPQAPQGNAKVASFRLATTERYRDRNGETRENTEWHSIVAWRSNADLVEKFVHKGTQIFIEGKLRTRQWTDQTGGKRFTTEVQADNIQLLGKRPDTPQQAQPGYGQGGNYGGQPQGNYGQGGHYGGQPQGGYQGPGYAGQGSAQGGYAGQSAPATPAHATQGIPQAVSRIQPAAPASASASQPSAPAQQPAPASAYPAPGAPDDDLPF